MNDWQDFDREARGFYRTRATTLRMTLKLGDDTAPLQTWQAEGYPGELRAPIQRHGEVGFSSMPLPGAGAHVSWHAGNRGHGTIVSVEDPRYRPKGLKGGEFLLYVVTGADAKGANGTMKPILKGTVDGHGKLTGIVIDIGDSDTTTINITGSSKVIVKAPDVEVSNGGTVQPVKLADGSNSTVLKAQ